MIESHFTINSDAVTSRYDGRVPPPQPESSRLLDQNTAHMLTWTLDIECFKTETNIVRSKLSWQYGELIFLYFSFINVYASGMFK